MIRIPPSACLALLLFAAPLRAAPDISASFLVTADGWRVGQLDASYREINTRYAVTLKGGATGIFGFLFQATYDGKTRGHLNAAGRHVPDVFRARSHRIFKTRHQEVDFTRGLPTKITINPARDMTALSDPALITDQRMDPLSFLGIFLEDRRQGCPKPANLYDGRRLTRVSFAEVPMSADTITCKGIYQIVKGPDHSIRKGYRKFGVVLTYKKGDTHGAARLDRVDFTSGSNTLVLRRLPGT